MVGVCGPTAGLLGRLPGFVTRPGRPGFLEAG